MNQAIYKYVH